MRAMRSLRACTRVLLAAAACCLALHLARAPLPAHAAEESGLMAAGFTVEAYGPEDFTVHLGAANFTELISKQAFTMIEFYAPWCGHCKELAPEYRLAAWELERSGQSQAKLAMIDCVVHESTCRDMGVNQFPTLVLVRADSERVVAYEGERSARAIVDFMQRQNQVTHVVVKDLAHLHRIVRKDVMVILAYVEKDSPEHALFLALTEATKGFYYMAVSHDRAHAVSMQASFPSLHVYLKDYQKQHHSAYEVLRDGEWSVANIQRWLKVEAFPPFAFITPQTYPYFRARQLPRVWFFVDVAQDSAALMRVGTALGEEFKGRLQLVWADYNAHADFVADMKVDPAAPLPAVVLEDGNVEITWVFQPPPEEEGGLSLETLRAWIHDLLLMKIKSTVRSEPIPTAAENARRQLPGNRLRGTEKLVALNFEERVFETNDTAFIVMVGSKPCAMCKLFNPTFRAVARAVGEEVRANASTQAAADPSAPPAPNVVFAHFDMVLNSLRAQPLPLPDGLPYILYVPAASKDKFNGTIMYRGGERNQSVFEGWVRNVLAGGDGGQKHLEPVPRTPDEEVAARHRLLLNADGLEHDAAFKPISDPAELAAAAAAEAPAPVPAEQAAAIEKAAEHASKHDPAGTCTAETKETCSTL